jgi:hypothetical protein
MTNSPPKTSGKLALVLQFWDGDRDAAFRNALRIADNEPAFRKDVEFVFVSRFDSLLDKEVAAKVAKKFKTSSFRCTRRGTGWPSGCNDMWADWVCTGAMGKVFSREWDDVKAMFTFEADAIPVHTDWIDRLSAEWDRAAEKGKYIVGCFMPPPQNGPVGHINGNALFAPDLFRRQSCVLGCNPGVGWDAAHAGQFEPHWYPTPLITNYYRAVNVAEKHIRRAAEDGRTPVVIHGAKDLSVEQFADSVLRK